MPQSSGTSSRHLDRALAQITRLLDDAQGSAVALATISTEMRSLQERVSRITAVLLDGDGKSLTTRVALLENKVETLSEDLDSHEQDNDKTISETGATFESSLAALRQELKDLKDKLEQEEKEKKQREQEVKKEAMKARWGFYAAALTALVALILGLVNKFA